MRRPDRVLADDTTVEDRCPGGGSRCPSRSCAWTPPRRRPARARLNMFAMLASSAADRALMELEALLMSDRRGVDARRVPPGKVPVRARQGRGPRTLPQAAHTVPPRCTSVMCDPGILGDCCLPPYLEKLGEEVGLGENRTYANGIRLRILVRSLSHLLPSLRFHLRGGCGGCGECGRVA